jgi:hypothetical protein
MKTVTIQARSLVWFVTGVVTTLVATLAVMNAWRVDAAPGDDDATFVPISPCRLLDTREPAWNLWGPNVTQSLSAHGANGACFIPTDAVGLSMNVTAVRPTEPTFLTAWPDDEPMPNASSLNPMPGQPPTPNAVTTELAPNGRFRVYNLQGHVHVIIDINGYYTPASLLEIDGRLNALERSSRYVQVDADSSGASILRGNGVKSVHRSLAGIYQVEFVESVEQCAWFVSRNDIAVGVAQPGEITVEQVTVTDPTSLWVRTFDSAGNQVDMEADDGFSLHVVC